MSYTIDYEVKLTQESLDEISKRFKQTLPAYSSTWKLFHLFHHNTWAWIQDVLYSLYNVKLECDGKSYWLYHLFNDLDKRQFSNQAGKGTILETDNDLHNLYTFTTRLNTKFKTCLEENGANPLDGMNEWFETFDLLKKKGVSANSTLDIDKVITSLQGVLFQHLSILPTFSDVLDEYFNKAKPQCIIAPRNNFWLSKFHSLQESFTVQQYVDTTWAGDTESLKQVREQKMNEFMEWFNSDYKRGDYQRCNEILMLSFNSSVFNKDTINSLKENDIFLQLFRFCNIQEHVLPGNHRSYAPFKHKWFAPELHQAYNKCVDKLFIPSDVSSISNINVSNAIRMDLMSCATKTKQLFFSSHEEACLSFAMLQRNSASLSVQLRNLYTKILLEHGCIDYTKQLTEWIDTLDELQTIMHPFHPFVRYHLHAPNPFHVSFKKGEDTTQSKQNVTRRVLALICFPYELFPLPPDPSRMDINNTASSVPLFDTLYQDGVQPTQLGELERQFVSLVQ